MKVLFAADHAGFELKEVLMPFVKFLGNEVVDYGAYTYDAADDYPDMISKVAHEISKNPDNTTGIILGGSGQGEAIVANRFPNVRAMVYNGQHPRIGGKVEPNKIIVARQHNDANILSLGARYLSAEEAKSAVRLWLTTKFSREERHMRRIKKIEEVTKMFTSHVGVGSGTEVMGGKRFETDVEIIPAIMPDSYKDLYDKHARVKEYSSIVQIDIMDGKFVPSKSWPYRFGANIHVPRIDFDFEIDMMVVNPEDEIEQWIAAGAKRVIIHIESVRNIREVFAKIPSGVELGIALDTTTSNNKIYPLIEKVDFVQFMGIEKIGYQGQAFDKRVLEKVSELRKKYARIIISVDGGVNLETASLLKRVGANRLVSGSTIFESTNIKSTIEELKNI